MRPCTRCGSPILCHAATKFCSHKCYSESRKGTAPRGGFERGIIPGNKAVVGTVSIRIRHKRGNATRAWIKIAEPNVWIENARFVWTQANGPIPERHHIHHIDRNKLNDAIENLECVSPSQHGAEHHSETVEARKRKGGYGEPRAKTAMRCDTCGATFLASPGKMARTFCQSCGHHAAAARSKARAKARKIAGD